MELPKGGLIGRTAALVRKLREMEIPGHAANAGYFIVLSVFPALVLVLSLLRYTPLDAGDLLDLLAGFLPEALMASAERLVISTYAHTSGTVVSLSAVGALWSASRGIYGLITGLNRIYGVEEDRGYLHIRLLSVGYTFAFLAVLVLTLVLGVFGEALLALLPPASGGLGILLTEVLDLRGLWMLLLQTGVFAAMFVYLPSGGNRLRESLPGAVLAGVGWMVFTRLFSFYVEHFSGYSNVYGSVYAVALGMLWLYFCMSILFYGGALNLLLAREKI